MTTETKGKYTAGPLPSGMETEIVYLDGAYEVHPDVDGQSWKVVNGETGRVRSSYSDQDEAIAAAKELNA